MWKTPLLSLPFPRNSSLRLRLAAFTLVELLVAMTVLVLIVVMFAQVIGSTSASIVGSTNGMNMDQAASIALDRIGNTIRNMVASGSGTLVVIKYTGMTTNASLSASDGLAMISNQRVRNRSSSTNSNYYDINVTMPTNIRMGAFGFCVMNPITTGPSPTPAPMLNWGDGTVSYATPATATSYMQGQPASALMSAAGDVSVQVTGIATPTTATPILQFSPVNASIFRFEVCCLLSDGTIASGIQGTNGKPLTLLNQAWPTTPTPFLPRNKYFVTGEALAAPPVSLTNQGEFPLAFDTMNTDAAPDATSNGQNVYVRAIIVGIASLDANTQKILNSNQVQLLCGSTVLAKADGLTPLATWDVSSATTSTSKALSPTGPNHFPAAVLQNIHFSQRYYYVN